MLWRIFLIVTIFFAAASEAEIYRANICPSGYGSDRVGSIRILDQKELIYPEISGKHFSEISDLAYLKDRHWLFMLSDEGKLFRFRARFAETIRELTPLDANSLRKSNGKKLKRWRRDSEGMTLDGRGRLYVSFEEKPRIARITYDGRILRYLPLPPAIDKMKKFRGKNKGLEALAWHPKYGLLTAAEYPVKKSSVQIQTIYSLAGYRWRFRRGKEKHSAVTAMEILDDGNVLVLERAYSGPFEPRVITLRMVRIDHCRGGLCPTKVLARFDSSEGWAVDNFEGLAKVGPNRFVMISDDNDNFFQKTLLIYFEVLEH
ncbi:esterase-like activity of phytase family protein [Nitratifractor sp.]